MSPQANDDPNCVEPACRSKVDLFRSSMGIKKPQGEASVNSGVTSSKKEKEQPECPLNREELGNATWGVLHSMGIYYPDQPTPEYQEKTKNFIQTLSLLYPCSHCAEDFQQEIKKSPPRVDSRTSFSTWLCEQHNIVNKKIGKKSFPCTMEKLEERWRKGVPACWKDEDGEEADEDVIPASLGRD